MATVANLWGLILGVVAFAFWTFSRLPRPHGRGPTNVLGGLGIVALIFSTVSPDDDLFQKELIRPAAESVNVASCMRAVPRRPFAAFSINPLAVAVDPVLAPRTDRLLVTDQRLHLAPHSATLVLIHSPPSSLATDS